MATEAGSKGQPDGGQSIILEGFYWQEKVTPAEKVVEKAEKVELLRSGKKKMLRYFLSPLNAFSKDTKERYLVLRKTVHDDTFSPDEEIKVIEVYDHVPNWSKGANNPPRERYNLEDLYHPHKYDTDRKKSNSLNHQLTLYFRDSMKIKKLELWFRKDDRQKRNTWSNIIQDQRIEIDDEIKQKIHENLTQQIRVNVPYYGLSDSFFPDVQYEGISSTFDKYAEIDQKKRQRIADNVSEWSKNLSEGKMYHILIREYTGRHPKPEFNRLQDDALRYDVEFINGEGEKCFSFGSHEYRSSGPYDGVDFFRLYGFNIKPQMFEKSISKGIRGSNVNEESRYELEIKLPNDDAFLRFKTKIMTLQKTNKIKIDMTDIQIRGRCHTAPTPVGEKTKGKAKSHKIDSRNQRISEYVGLQSQTNRQRTTSEHLHFGSENIHFATTSFSSIPDHPSGLSTEINKIVIKEEDESYSNLAGPRSCAKMDIYAPQLDTSSIIEMKQNEELS